MTTTPHRFADERAIRSKIWPGRDVEDVVGSSRSAPGRQALAIAIRRVDTSRPTMAVGAAIAGTRDPYTLHIAMPSGAPIAQSWFNQALATDGRALVD